uniref:Uncharacterized protein n=1 Tax=Kalanchoe fedtschenkoi TaxID=63787 RepID=A0A7N0V827_KALFE
MFDRSTLPAPWDGSSRVRCCAALSPISTFSCFRQAANNVPHMTTSASIGMVLITSSASSSLPARPRRSMMHP